MVETISLAKWSYDDKLILLKELGYSTDGTFVLEATGERVIDNYINEPVKIENMLILPGSTIIIDNNPMSVAGYLQEHPDAL